MSDGDGSQERRHDPDDRRRSTGERAEATESQRRAYWRINLTYVGVLLGIWFTVSYGFGILLVDELDRIRLGGFKLGFWFAQQGSIYVFVVLVFVYAWLMNRLDRRFDVDED